MKHIKKHSNYLDRCDILLARVNLNSRDLAHIKEVKDLPEKLRASSKKILIKEIVRRGLFNNGRIAMDIMFDEDTFTYNFDVYVFVKKLVKGLSYESLFNKVN